VVQLFDRKKVAQKEGPGQGTVNPAKGR